MQLRLWRYDLPLRHAFTISRGTLTVQPTLIVGLEQDGLWGYGEATSNTYYEVTIDDMVRSLERLRGAIADTQLQTPEAFWDACQTELGDQPFAQCALDQAANDLWGKLRGQPLWKLWNLNPAASPKSNYTIGIDDPEVMAAKLREFPGWPIYKIKLGLGPVEDIRIIDRLRQETDAVFRVDANCGWTAAQTIAMSHELAQRNVEFIEQPLPAEHRDQMPHVKRESALPLIADESCLVESDVPLCSDGFHGVNIKLVKCGGLTPARRMIAAARGLNLKVMIGCMTESTVGISAIAQLLPLLDYVDMDGAVLLAEDIALGAEVVLGECRFPEAPGSGVRLLREGAACQA